MCFSAPASFTASALLAGMGVFLIARAPDKRWLPLAMIPWFFALQQFSEGMVWLHPGEASRAKGVFLVFAYVVWPIWIPLSLYVAEESPLRRQLLALCLGSGLVLACFLVLVIPQTSVMVYSNSIHYLENTSMDVYWQVGLFFYVIAGLTPFFISSLPKVWAVGLLITLAGVATYLLERHCFVSLWCFWSALISLSLFFVVTGKSSCK